MSLFGEKCARCGTRTRNKEDDKAICESCAQELHLLIEAGKEELRACPIDGTTMCKEIAHVVVIDRCPTCSGVWLDGGELDKMRNGAESEALMLMATGLAYPM